MTKTISRLAMAAFAIIGAAVIPAQALIKIVPIQHVSTIGATAIAPEAITSNVITNCIQINSDRLIVAPPGVNIARIAEMRQITGVGQPITIGITVQTIQNGIEPILQRAIGNTISTVINQTETATILIV
jgi:hypothetical protein